MIAFNEAWNILKSRFADTKERFERESRQLQGLDDAARDVRRLVPRFNEGYRDPTPEELERRKQENNQALMAQMVREQMQRNMQQSKISPDASDELA